MGQDAKLEEVIDEVLKSGDSSALDVFLQKDIHDGTPFKCTKQFVTKVDKLVSRSLGQKDSKSASLGLTVLYKCGKNVKLPGGCEGLAGLISQGLLKKWFEKCRQLWIQCGPQWDEALINLSEDFFDALMVAHGSCKEGTDKITEYFLYPVGELAVDPRVYIVIQKEAIRKFNLILDKIPADLKKKKKILTSQEASDIMIKLAGQILESGDYDLQTALMEALCRMASPDQRKELADRWFSMEHVAKAFVKIHDSEFETDCRKFLNLVNGMQGDSRRVYSYPCLEVYLDKHELMMPADEKLEEFWIDFNLGSHSISFYFSATDEEGQDGQWETICINENEVQSYAVTEKGKRKVLEVKLSEVVVVGAVEGSSLIIHFSSFLDIVQAVQRVFGHRKNESFVGKTGTSVVKTTVNIIMEENSSQVVPESQVSLGDKNTASDFLPASKQMVTPAKMRMSESTTFISSCGGGSVHGASSLCAVMPSKTPSRSKEKPSLEMVCSRDQQGEHYLGKLRPAAETCSHGTTPNSTKPSDIKEQNLPAAVLAGQGEEQTQDYNFVPDTQPTTGKNISSEWNKFSVSEMLIMPTQKMPRSELHPSLAQQPKRRTSAQKSSVSVVATISQKQFHTELTHRLEKVISEKTKVPAPQEPPSPQRKFSDIQEKFKDRSSADQCASTFTPKDQQAQRKVLAKGKSKDKMSLEGKPSNTEAETNTTLSSKAMRNAAVAGSMVKLISSHYEINTQSTAKHCADDIPLSWMPPIINKQIFSNSWSAAAEKEVSGAFSLKKSHRKPASDSSKQKGDIFEFNIDPPLTIKEKNKTFTNTFSSGIHDSSGPVSTAKKGQPVAKEKRYVKKHLFSDTDTDYTMTEVSWLRESSRKPKPKVTKYSRRAPAKPKPVSAHTSYESSDLLSPHQKPAKDNIKPNKKRPDERVEQSTKVKPAAAAQTNRPHAAGWRPQRAAAISTKSYREPDTDDSQSESKYSSADHVENAAQETKKKTTSKKTNKSYLKLQSNHHSSRSPSKSVSEQPSTSKKYFVGQQGKNEKACSEVAEAKTRKKNASEKSTDTYRILDSNNHSGLKKPSGLKQQRPENVLPETSKLNKKNVAPAQEQTNASKYSWAARQTSFHPSPPFIERMRSAERSAPTLDLTRSPLLTPRGSPLPASPDPPRQDTPSPILLLPRPHSKVSSKGNSKPSSLHSAENQKRSSSKTRSIQSVLPFLSLTPIGQTLAPSAPPGPSAAKISPVQQHLASPPPSPLPLSAQPPLTSTLLELDKLSMPSPLQSPFPDGTFSGGCHYGFSKTSTVSLSVTSTKSSACTERVKSSPAAPLTASLKAEKTPPSGGDVKPAQLHVSGPSRKRHMSSSSDSEEDEKEEKKKRKTRAQHSSRMKPRKLFKSSTTPLGQGQSWGEQRGLDEEEKEESRPEGRIFKATKERLSEQYQSIKTKTVKYTTDCTAETELSQVMSSSQMMSTSHWEAEVGDGDMDIDEDLELPKTVVNPGNLCQQLSSELKKKFKNRFQMMEVYNKQSLKTVQEHVSSLDMQVTKHRIQRLEQVQKVLLEEIAKLEQDDTALKNMEKDLTMCWKKQTIAFHSYHEQETRRNESLKKALQSDLCHSLEYEERVFTSQMCLIRKDMKSVQDRLLCRMQEGEIQSVKRGLHALFFP